MGRLVLVICFAAAFGLNAAPMGILVPANEVSLVRSLNQSAPATQLKISAARGGVATVQISGAPGTYELQAAPDLLSWSVLATVSAATNRFSVTDPAATNAARRYYRTRQ